MDTRNAWKYKVKGHSPNGLFYFPMKAGERSLDIFKLVGKIVLDDTGFSAGIDESTGKAKKAETAIGKAFKKIGTAIATYLTVDAIKNFGQACVNAAADAQAAEAQFTQVFGDFESDARSSLTSIADSAGITENRMKGSFTKIAAFAKTTGMDTESALALTERAMIAVADSAAFYDRTLEDTTESLQSFLKGNYENDAALGLSCTETTRNAAATELWGKKFNELSEAQKQLTLLQMVEDANELSGAMGQAARESETWTNQVGNLKQAWTDFQAEIGQHVLPTVVDIVGRLSEFVQTATEKVDPAMQLLTEKFQLFKGWISDIGSYISEKFKPIFDDLTGAIKAAKDTIQPFIDKLKNYVKSGEAAEDATNLLKDAIDFVADAYETVKGMVEDCIVAYQDACEWVEEHKVGLEILASVIGVVTTALAVYTAAQAIANAGGVARIALLASIRLQYALSTLSLNAYTAATWLANTATTAFSVAMSFLTSPITLVVAAIAAVIAIIVLCVKHWDEIKAKAIEVAAVISEKWEEIKTATAEKIASMVATVTTKFNEIKTTISSKLNDAVSKAKESFENIKTTIATKVDEAYQKVKEAFENIKNSIQEAMQAAKDKVSQIWEEIKNVFSDAVNVGKKIVDDIKQGISDAWNGLVSWFEGLWNSLFGSRNVNVNVNANGSGVNGSHASGLDYVPFDGYVAELHKGEMVVPAAEARLLRSGTQEASTSNDIASILMMILDAVQEGNGRETVLKINNREFGRLVRGVT